MENSPETNQLDAAEPRRTVKVFICYRRDDAAATARWLHMLLDKFDYVDRSNERCRLQVYFDQAAPGVADWRALHRPSLESAHAFIALLSPGLAKDFSSEGVVDWVHEEISWWINHRGAPPIAIDPTGNPRWVPEAIRSRWPQLNRLLVDPSRVLGEESTNSKFALTLRQRIVDSIIESETATAFEEWNRSKRRTRQLKWATSFAAAGLVVALMGWYWAYRNWALAETQESIARESVGFLTGLFATADPDSTFRETLTVKRLLQVAKPAIDAHSSSVVRAHLLRSMGLVHVGLGDAEAAIDVLQQARRLFDKVGLRAEDEFRLEFAFGEAYLYSADAFDKALEHLNRADRLSSSDEIKPTERAAIKGLLGDFYAWSTPPLREKAKSLYEESLGINIAAADSSAIARDHNRLGTVSLEMQDFASARRHFLASISALETLPDDANALLTAKYEHDYGAMLYEQGDFSAALDRFSDSSDAFRRTYGDESVEYGVAENNVGRLMLELDRREEALVRSTNAASIESSAMGANFPPLAFALNTRALALLTAGQLVESKLEFERALDIAKRNEMAIGAQSLVHLAEIELRRGDLPAAEKNLSAAHEYFEQFEIKDGWRFALYQNALGELHLRECDMDDARRLLAESGTTISRRWPHQNLFTRAAAERQRNLEAVGDDPKRCR